jgi:hypothetical protein
LVPVNTTIYYFIFLTCWPNFCIDCWN